MNAFAPSPAWPRLVTALIIGALIALGVLIGGPLLLSVLWFGMPALLGAWIVWLELRAQMAFAAPAGRVQPRVQVSTTQVPPANEFVPDAVSDVMDVRMTVEREGVAIFRGPLRRTPNAAFEHVRRSLGDARVPLLQEDPAFGAALVIIPSSQATPSREVERRTFPWVNWLLFALTIVTTTWAGAAHAGIDVFRNPARLAAGLPYALGLLAILGVHELGHYFAARHHGIRVTLPYFIPVPFGLGTFGAFIQMKSPSENRKALFDVAVAGPIAGLVIAIPALLIGIQSSTIAQSAALDVAAHTGTLGGTTVGSSILFALLSKLALGDALQYGHVLKLSPLAFAGWLGLLVTALNLLPIGQLDGGHMSQGMFGSRAAAQLSRAAMWTLFLLALFVWPGLFMWAILVFFLAGHPEPPLNDLTPIGRGRRAVGYVMFAVLAAIIAPLPHALWTAVGIHCPYL